MIDFNKLKRDHKIGSKLLKPVKDQLIVEKDFYIIFPTRYMNVGLGDIGNTIVTVAIFAIIDGDRYTLSLYPNLIATKPSLFETIQIDGKPYYKASYTKGDVFIDNVNVVRLDTLPSVIAKEFVVKGNMPVFLSVRDGISDYSIIHDRFKDTADNALGNEELIGSVITSIVMRNPENIKEPYRLYKGNKLPTYVSISNKFAVTKANFSRLTSSRLNDGIVAMLSEPSDQVTEVEKPIRR